MARYIKKFKTLASSGPTEERGFAIWAAYDIVGVDDDLTQYGLTKVEEWPEGVAAVTRVEPDDHALYAKLGIQRSS